MNKNSFVDYPSLIKPSETLDHPFIFVSYARKDLSAIQPILKALKKRSFNFWYDIGLKSGIEWADQIGDKIDQCDQFLVFMSPNSVKSKYVHKEIGMAIDKNKNMLIVYLETTELTNGLHLLLKNVHSLHKEVFTTNKEFFDAICNSASSNTLLHTQNADIFKSKFWDNYEYLSQIGQSGISEVFQARHKRTGMIVAVKCGFLTSSNEITDNNGAKVSILYHEKEILSELSRNACPYVPAILDWFQDDNQTFLVESMISGKSLNSQTFYSEKEIVQLTRKILESLQYLHKNNIIHRDIKPSNLIQNKLGDIYFLDFNISDFVHGNSNSFRGGTTVFSSPEQFILNYSSHYSSDIYAVGQTIKFLLSPEHFNSYNDAPIRYYRKDISVEFEEILEKMTDAAPACRYQSTEEILHVLKKYRRKNIFHKIRLYIRSRKRIHQYSTFENKSRVLRSIIANTQITPLNTTVLQDNTYILGSDSIK